jgi:dipeptidyl aminopeptidase/acylaminoacyl peptidase
MACRRPWVVALAAAVLAPAPLRAELPPLIPREILFGNPVKASPQISPDGKRLSYLAPDRRNVLQVWVKSVGKDDDRPVTFDRRRGIRIYFWAYQPDTLLDVQDSDGDENAHVFSIDLKTGITRDLTPFVGIRAEMIGLSRDHPNEMLVALNLFDRRVHDVYRIDLTTGAIVLDTKNPGDVVYWGTDPDFKVRVAQATTPDGGVAVRYRKSVRDPWQTALKWGPNDAGGQVIGFTADGKSLWLKSSRGRDTLAVVKHDLETGKETVVAADPSADSGAVMYNPLTHAVQAATFTRDRLKWQVLDPDIAADLEVLRKAAPSDVRIIDEDRDLRYWVVDYSSDKQPGDFYLYHRPTKKRTQLFAGRPELEKYTLAEMKPVVIPSRDGLDLVSYLTLPVGVSPKNLPLVLLVHGGPWDRNLWGYDGQVQWLANRGYAVLQVNYRGSTGFGKKFVHAGDREWGGKMHDDLIDGVQWAIKTGIADPKRVAIFGGSYGGYAALVGAAFTPDVFACAVDVVGPSNLVTMLKSLPPYWTPLRKMFTLRVGDVMTEEEFLKSRSPLFKADRIKIPLLIAQGANDPRVKRAESEQIVQALRAAGKPVKYLLFPDEGHGFLRPENRLKFYAAAERFLKKYLGGRAEPGR